MKRRRSPRAHCSNNDTEVPQKVQKTPTANKQEHIKIVTDTHSYQDVVMSAAFVDKTLHIRSFWQFKGRFRTLLFAAPFRCGKSTNMDMVKTFLSQEVDVDGRPKINVIWNNETERWEEQEHQTDSFKLFKELQIYQCQHEPRHTQDECMRGKCEHRNFFYENCGKHVVIFLDLQSVQCRTLERLESDLQRYVRRAFLEHEYLLGETSCLSKSEKDFISSNYINLGTAADAKHGLMDLVAYLVKYFQHVDNVSEQPKNRKKEKRKVFVMVEEYDAAISLLLKRKDVTEEYMDKVMEIIGITVGSVLKGNPNVSGGLINACRDVKGALSNYANNVESVLFLEDDLFSTYCGFTDAEVTKILENRAFKNVDKSSLTDYNGYHVLDQPQVKVYNTYSILKHLDAWVRLRKENNRSPQKGAVKPRKYYVERGIHDLDKMFSIDCIRENIWQILAEKQIVIPNTIEKLTVGQLFLLKELLHHSPGKKITQHQITLFFHYLRHHGYLFATTINDDLNNITLEIPNKEIVKLFIEKLWSSSFYRKKYNVEPEQYVTALLGLDRNKPDTFEVLTQAIVNMFPSLLPSRHDELKGILYSFPFTSRKFSCVESEPYVVDGRFFQCDLKIWRHDGVGILLEVASAGKNEEEALDQIFKNRYCESLDNKEGCSGKVYIGLLYEYGLGHAKICAYATDGNTVTKTLSKKQKQCLIQKAAEKKSH